MEEPGICVVDDDPSVLRSLRELLGSDGFDAQIFDSPERFMDYARTHSIRLAVLDVWMPTQSGLELQERLRTQSPQTAVIIITARDGPNVRTRAWKAEPLPFWSNLSMTGTSWMLCVVH